MNDDKLHPLRTGDGQWHNATSHEADPEAFRARMHGYRRREQIRVAVPRDELPHHPAHHCENEP